MTLPRAWCYLRCKYTNIIKIEFKIYKYIIKGGDGQFENCTSPMVDPGTYEFKTLNTDKITPEEYLTGAYLKEVFIPENILTFNQQLHTILDSK